MRLWRCPYELQYGIWAQRLTPSARVRHEARAHSVLLHAGSESFRVGLGVHVGVDVGPRRLGSAVLERVEWLRRWAAGELVAESANEETVTGVIVVTELVGTQNGPAPPHFYRRTVLLKVRTAGDGAWMTVAAVVAGAATVAMARRFWR